jgi:hypothetical protein
VEISNKHFEYSTTKNIIRNPRKKAHNNNDTQYENEGEKVRWNPVQILEM